MTAKAFISGCQGLRLSADETHFFRDERPWGLILFARNCETPDQIRELIDTFRDAVGDEDAPVLIDQEGGRVQRLKEPHWRAYPSPETLISLAKDRVDACDLAFAHGRLLASDLEQLGITVDCLPVLDLRFPETHSVIGDRSFGRDPGDVAALAMAQTNGLMAGGVLPVMKHIPGHGRAQADSHLELPSVSTALNELRKTDFAPFQRVADQIPMAMTAHIIYSALDAQKPATLSFDVIQTYIRGEIGFDGLLMTDDLSMKALTGSFEDRMRQSIDAGCDMGLHCNGDLGEMRAVASAAPELAGGALRRADTAKSMRQQPDGADLEALRERLGLVSSPTV